MNSQKHVKTILVGLTALLLACAFGCTSGSEYATVIPIHTSTPLQSIQTPVILLSRSFPTPPPLPTRIPLLTPIPTFYATLYPYSLDSVQGWSTYTDTANQFSFLYPAASPLAEHNENPPFYLVSVQARYDSLHRNAIAFIYVAVYDIPDGTSLDDFVNQTPWERSMDRNDQDLIPLADALKGAGAEEAIAYRNSYELPTCAALYNGRIYILSQGVLSDSPEQLKIFNLLVQSFRFLP